VQADEILELIRVSERIWLGESVNFAAETINALRHPFWQIGAFWLAAHRGFSLREEEKSKFVKRQILPPLQWGCKGFVVWDSASFDGDPKKRPQG
jgi:hypothetical protein